MHDITERFLLSTLMDNLPDGIYFKDSASRYVRINRALAEACGLNDPADAVGKTDFDFFPEPQARSAYADEQEIIRTGQPIIGKEERAFKSGRPVGWVSTTKMPLRDEEGVIIGTFGVSRHITELKHAEEALQQANARLDLAVRSSNMSIWEQDMPDGRIENSHPTLINVWELLGYEPRSSPTDFGSVLANSIYPDDLERVEGKIQQLLASDGGEYENEYRVRTKGGAIRWHLGRGMVLRDPEGRPVRFIGTSTDITDRKRTEEALRERERELDSLLGHLPGLAYRALADKHWTALFASKGVENLTGYPEDEFTSHRLHYDDIMLREDRSATRKTVYTALRERRMYEVEHRIRDKDGSIRWIWARGHGVFAPDGSLRFIEGLNLDMTRQKEAEAALRASEQRFRVFVDHAADAFFLTTEQGRILDANQRACESLGYTRDELIGMTPFDFVPDLTPAVFADRIRRLRAGETLAFELENRHKDGTIFPAEVRVKGFWEGAEVFHVSLVRDVSERKRAEVALRHANDRVELAVRSSNIAIWEFDMPDGRIETGLSTLVNMWELLGYDPGTSPRDFSSAFGLLVHPDDQERVGREIHALLASDGQDYENEVRVRTKDGSIRWNLVRGTVVRDAEGKPIRFIGTSADITDLKRAEAALRESEQRFRGTFENAAVGIVHNDSAGYFLRFNEKYCDIVGYSREELLQMNLRDIIHPADLAAFSELYASSFVCGETPALGWERRYLRKDGSTVWVEVFASFQRDVSGRPAYAIAAVQDISERKRLDAELRQAKDSAEAGNRAKDDFLANVSHEIRTPMNAIIGMTELVLDTPLDESQRQGLKTVKTAADSLLGIINDLLDFSKIEANKLELVPANFSLRGAVGDTLRALAVRAHKKWLELIYQVQPEVPDALIGDAGRLRQVLLNLVGNAVKFTDEGEIVVRVEVAGDLVPEGEVGLLFTVLDTGIGIPPDQQERIFRAFEQEDTSTTRKFGGTGLGLTIAARLVALMGGTITVESEPGRGSTFAFTARFSRQPHPPEQILAEPPLSLRDLPVLVVDDNATNRHILAEWLRSWQMDPAMVGDGMAAMDSLWHRAANGRPYALVLLDARMPDADGLMVAAMIRERAELAATRIILLTSGERPGDPARVRELRIDAQLLKPVQQDELLEAIYRVMSRSQSNVPPVPRHTPTQQTASPVTTTTPLYILVAEDNELSAQVLEQSLVRQGHRVRLASTGLEALALAGQEVFDLLVLDVHMPELDGFQVVRAIRQRELTAGGHLPVIALTARSRKEDRERCLAAGMDDFQIKPIRPADLLTAIDRVIRTHSSPQRRKRDLIDAKVLLATCGDDPDLLGKMCQTLTARVPEHLAALREALHDQDAPRLREAAHKCCGLLSEFSSAAGDLAGSLEDLAAGTQIDRATPILEKLETTAHELVEQIDGITVEELRREAEGISGQ
jgi:two-component system sensor histidine kinase/response regulator